MAPNVYEIPSEVDLDLNPSKLKLLMTSLDRAWKENVLKYLAFCGLDWLKIAEAPAIEPFKEAKALPLYR